MVDGIDELAFVELFAGDGYYAVDLLDRSNSYRRAVTAEYREDIIGNTLGRFFLAGVSFSFGKMNARNNSTAQNAMINMLY